MRMSRMQVCSRPSSAFDRQRETRTPAAASAARGFNGFHGATGGIRWEPAGAAPRGRAREPRSRLRQPLLAQVGAGAERFRRGDLRHRLLVLEAGSNTWKEAIIERIGRPCWMACTRRALKPAAVADAIDLVDDRRRHVAGSRKYPCSECGNRSSTVRVAATRA